MIKLDTIIAIDPDVDKSGVAYLNCATREMKLHNLAFPDLLDYIKYIQRQAEVTGSTYKFVVEAGWLIKTHWHVKQTDSRSVCAAKGNQAGRNHETGRKIVEMMVHWQIPHELIRPLHKCWKGPDRKISHEELVQFINIKGRTNQETRDAALIAWIFAGFSVKMKQKQ